MNINKQMNKGIIDNTGISQYNLNLLSESVSYELYNMIRDNVRNEQSRLAGGVWTAFYNISNGDNRRAMLNDEVNKMREKIYFIEKYTTK